MVTKVNTRVVIVTQNEILFLAPAIDYLLRRVATQCEVVGVVVLPASPFGKEKSYPEGHHYGWHLWSYFCMSV